MIAYCRQPDTDPALEVLLSIVTCEMYTIYWDYKVGKKIAFMMQLSGMTPADNSVLYLVLNFVGFGFIPMLIQQSHLNDIWRTAGQQ